MATGLLILRIPFNIKYGIRPCMRLSPANLSEASSDAMNCWNIVDANLSVNVSFSTYIHNNTDDILPHSRTALYSLGRFLTSSVWRTISKIFDSPSGVCQPKCTDMLVEPCTHLSASCHP